MFIEEIERLGKRVDSLWEEKGRDKDAFSKIAAALLKESQIHNHFSFDNFLDELLKIKEFPPQLDPSSKFGQPPVTLYRAKDFVIDIYFWIGPDISIHSHGFQGAFTVLQGLSFQSHYGFEVKENLNDHALIGDLHLQKARLIHTGDVEEILAGPEFIHQVWHLGYPTISLAIRTSEMERIQYAYIKPHLAIRSHSFPPPGLQKQIGALLMLRRLHRPEESHLLQLASSLEPDQALVLLYFYFATVGDLTLIERVVANLPELQKWASPFLTSLKHCYETAFDMVEIQDLGERFLLALLNISSSRKQSEGLFQMVFPHQNFEKAVTGWFRSLLEKKNLRFEFNETAQEVFVRLFQGLGEDQICEKLSGIYEVENTEDFQHQIRHFCNQLRSCDLLKPLLPEPQALIPQNPEEPLSSFPGPFPLLLTEPEIADGPVAVDPESSNFFKAEGYWILRNVLDRQTLEVLSNYFFFREKNFSDFSEDSQVKGSKGCYGDPLCESLLLHLQVPLQKVTGKTLSPTYSYARIYAPGAVLEKHRDRPSCEISATLTIGYDAPALWPIFVQSHGKKIKVELDKGDLLVYKGCDLFHWREKFEGKFWVQIFLHFVDKNGEFAEWRYDKRKEFLGSPG